MDQGTELTRLALFGQPVKASLSPAIHGMFASQLGLDIEYRAIETGPDGFPRALEAFRDDGGVGCNITLPLKGLPGGWPRVVLRRPIGRRLPIRWSGSLPAGLPKPPMVLD